MNAPPTLPPVVAPRIDVDDEDPLASPFIEKHEVSDNGHAAAGAPELSNSESPPNQAPTDDDAEIARLAKLPLLDYEREREAAASPGCAS